MRWGEVLHVDSHTAVQHIHRAQEIRTGSSFTCKCTSIQRADTVVQNRQEKSENNQRIQ